MHIDADHTPNDFVTKWNIPAGTDEERTLTFPGVGSYTINWGDGSMPDVVRGVTIELGNYPDHPYPDIPMARDYEIVVSSVSAIAPSTITHITHFNLNNILDSDKLIDVQQWGTARWSSMENAFYDASNMTMNATDAPNLSNVSSMENMFRSAENFNTDINHWNVDNVRNMRFMFGGVTAFKQNLHNWNVANVSDMSFMFQSALAFNGNIGGWNVAKVENMNNMFSAAHAFNQNLNTWNVGRVRNMGAMFSNATAFNENISLWNVSSVTNMGHMFFGATLFNRDISLWNVSSVTDMSFMFQNAQVFNKNIGNWNVSNVENMQAMFEGALFFDQDIGNWNVARVTNMDRMFNGTRDFNQNQNLGPWYIVPTTTSNTFTLETQNGELDGHSPTYELVPDAEQNNLFDLNNDILTPKATTPTTSNTYNVRVKATGSLFGSANERTLSIAITDPTDATLSALMLSAGTLLPAFTSDRFVYTLNLDDTDPDLMLTPTTSQIGAMVTVNGESVTSGSAQPIALVIDAANTINIDVTATDRSTPQRYTINVIRAPVLALTAPANQVYAVGTTINLQLPEATGGKGSHTYTLMDGSNNYATPVNGLTFNPDTRTLSGTATTTAALATLTYTVMDSIDGIDVSSSATFTITVSNTYVSSTVDAASSTNADGLTEITLGQSDDSDIEATGTTITLPSGLSGATITIATLAMDSATLPADQPDETVADSQRSLVDIDVTGVSNGNPVTICLPHGGISNPGLYHAEIDADDVNSWVQLPSQQVIATLICGDATAFSPFAVFGGMQGLDAAAEAQVLNAILPQLLRATAKITVSNISNRIDQAFSSSPADTDASLNLGGSSSLQELINNNARTTLQDGLNIKQMLNNTSFLIPLNVAGDNNYGINNMTLWGSGDYLNLADNVSAVDWEGEVIGGSVGIDARLNQNLIAGAALSYSEGDVDYKRDGSENNSKGTLTNTLYSIHPYIAYDLSQGRVWGALGYGQGEVEI
ncbi:MAG: BspA family leucine-rich repeat surface protein, partial [Methylococcales symbiont of Hymedesmia sp. n. MRB-2018]